MQGERQLVMPRPGAVLVALMQSLRRAGVSISGVRCTLLRSVRRARLRGGSCARLRNADNFQAGLGIRLGSGFLTKDHTEYLLTEIGPMATYKLSRQLQAHVDVAYQMRYRKGFHHGVAATGGVRWLFD